MSSKIDQLIISRQRVTQKGPTAWLQAGSPHTLFTIVGGPVWIKGLIAYANVATGAASTFAITCCGVAMQNAAVVCNLLIGEMAIWPLQTGAGFIIIPNVAASAMPTIAAGVAGNTGVVASPGAAGGSTIGLTVGAADMVGAATWYVIYYAIDPAAAII